MSEKNYLPYLAGGGGYFYPLIFALDFNFLQTIPAVSIFYFLQIEL